MYSSVSCRITLFYRDIAPRVRMLIEGHRSQSLHVETPETPERGIWGFLNLCSFVRQGGSTPHIQFSPLSQPGTSPSRKRTGREGGLKTRKLDQHQWQESRKRGPQKRGPQSMSVSTMRGRYWISVSAFLFDSLPCESVEAELSHWFWRHRGSILNFRIGLLLSIGGRLPYPCLPTPFPILRSNFPVSLESKMATVWKEQVKKELSQVTHSIPEIVCR